MPYKSKAQTRKTPQQKAEEKYALINDKIIQLLERGNLFWQRPWYSNPLQNGLTGHVYSGFNPLLLSIDMLLYDWQEPYFLTFNQGKALGWSIKKGSKATYVRAAGKFAKDVEVTDPEGNTTTETQHFTFFKLHPVHHISNFDDTKPGAVCSKAKQIEKIQRKSMERQGFKPVPDTVLTPIEQAERLVAKNKLKLGVKIEHRETNRCFYSPKLDTVCMQPLSTFVNSPAYYATLIHELGHSTGHSTRLNRPGITNRCHFGSQLYAAEELVAELTSAYVLSTLDIDPAHQSHGLEQSAAYLKSWMQGLKNDQQYFFAGMKAAQRAANLLLSNADWNCEYEDVTNE